MTDKLGYEGPILTRFGSIPGISSGILVISQGWIGRALKIP